MIVKEKQFPAEGKDLLPLFYKVIPSSVLEINSILDKIMHVVQQLTFTVEEREDLWLATYEALANAIIHGNGTDPKKEVAVTCFFEYGNLENLVIVIQDEGHGFAPDSARDTISVEALDSSHGRGIYLMHRLVDEVIFFNSGRGVELRKRSRGQFR